MRISGNSAHSEAAVSRQPVSPQWHRTAEAGSTVQWPNSPKLPTLDSRTVPFQAKAEPMPYPQWTNNTPPWRSSGLRISRVRSSRERLRLTRIGRPVRRAIASKDSSLILGQRAE